MTAVESMPTTSITFRTAGIDIGPKNLGFALLEFKFTIGDAVPTVTPILWDNWNVIENRPSIEVAKEEAACDTYCCAIVKKTAKEDKICGKRAAFSYKLQEYYCKTHAQQMINNFAKSGKTVAFWGSPLSISMLRKACNAKGIVPLPTRKELLIKALVEHYIFSANVAKAINSLIVEPTTPRRITDKNSKKKKATLEEIEYGAECFIKERPELWTCEGIRIENQGAAQGASTKSLQIMLYTLIKHGYYNLGRNIPVSCINADDKTAEYSGIIVAEKGAKGYKSRKAQAIEMTNDLLKKYKIEDKWIKLFEDNADKQDDMADGFLMAYRLGMSYLRRDGHLAPTPVLVPTPAIETPTEFSLIKIPDTPTAQKKHGMSKKRGPVNKQIIPQALHQGIHTKTKK